ncbi:MAG: four helix bundle protein [Bacteroidota bacterium]|nr:four helix bundle protein [Bacteroidota bacterium]MDP4231429.1 four helix bundle protein [Bacteroidota bacterium]MDP4237084.1 four helix bundle protein [Bacteroidota bacterium]
MKEIEKFEDLEVWKAGMELVQEVYGLTENYPADEKQGLISQMRTAAIKVPAKIAAAASCGNLKISLWYLAIVDGLLAALEAHLKLSIRLNYVSKIDAAPILEKCKSIERMIEELILS